MLLGFIRSLIVSGVLALYAPASFSGVPEPRAEEFKLSSSSIQHWFKLGQSAMNSGRYEDAKRIFVSIFNATGSPRVLLDYAQALFRQGQWVEAKKIFVAAYDSVHVPASAKGLIKWHLIEIDKRLPQFGMSVSFISDSNPANFTYNKRVDLLGQSLTVVRPYSAKKAYGVGVNAYLSRPLLGSARWQGKVKLGATQYEEESLSTRSFGLGLNYQPDSAHRQTWTVEADCVFRRTDSDFMQYELGYQAAPEKWSRTTIRTHLLARQFDDSTANTEQASFAVSQMFPLNQDWLARGEVKATRYDAQLGFNRSNEFVLGLTTYRSVGKVHFAPSSNISVRRFDEENPFFNQTREDVRAKVGLALSVGQKKYKAWRPKLSVFYETQDSNLAYYDYNKMYAELSLEY